MKKPRRLAAKAAVSRKTKKAPARKLALKKAAPAEAISPDEVSHLEGLAARFAASEKAWQRMTAPPEEDPWSKVEDHLLKPREDSERHWKYFSK